MIDKVYIVSVNYHYSETLIDSVYIDEKEAIKRKTDMEERYRSSLDSMTIFIEEWKISQENL